MFVLVQHAGQPKSIRQTFLKERVLAANESTVQRNAVNSRRNGRGVVDRFKVYRLNLEIDVGRQTMICQHAFRNLLGLFKYQWKSLRASATLSLPGPIIHGNTGKRNRYDGSNKKTVEEDVMLFLTQVGEERGESYATRFIRDRTSVGLRKEEEDLIELPSCLSKRGLFKKFCFERGHVLLASSKGSYGKLEDFAPRPYDELLWPEGSETLPVVPWSVFHQIWKEKLPKLKIRNRCEDTCPECFVLKNRFKFKADRWQRRPESSDDSDAVSLSSSSSRSDFSDEELISQANEHVEQARSQRNHINHLKEVAEAERGFEHEARRFVSLFLL